MLEHNGETVFSGYIDRGLLNKLSDVDKVPCGAPMGRRNILQEHELVYIPPYLLTSIKGGDNFYDACLNLETGEICLFKVIDNGKDIFKFQITKSLKGKDETCRYLDRVYRKEILEPITKSLALLE